jgi:hypothetical protein
MNSPENVAVVDNENANEMMMFFHRLSFHQIFVAYLPIVLCVIGNYEKQRVGKKKGRK